jgi:hypothetical protein
LGAGNIYSWLRSGGYGSADNKGRRNVGQGDTTGKGTYQYDRVPFLVLFEEKSAFKETYAGHIGWVSLEGHLLRPKDAPSKTVLSFMHPTGVQLPADADRDGEAWLPPNRW